MKTLKQIKRTRVNLLLLSAAFLLVALAGAMTTRSSWTKLRTKAAFLLKAQTALMVQTAPVNATFTVRNYGGKCLEFGRSLRPIETVSTSYPVFISDCNGTAVQQIRVEELTDRPGHLVILHAGSRVIGKKLNTVPTQQLPFATKEDTGSAEQASSAALIFTSAPAQIPLEAQPYTGSPGQIFALDGDSIILAEDRNLVVEVQNNRGKNQTPLVLGRRELADAEFWTFTATNGSNLRPTSGFVLISFDNGGESRARLDFLNAVRNASRGTVIELDQNVSINLTNWTNVGLPYIPAGVTIRGDRRGTRPGPLLFALHDQSRQRNACFPESDVGMLIINGDHVRITGLRMQGPGRDERAPYASGIATQDQFSALIDHNELFDWPAAAIYVNSDNSDGPVPTMCDPSSRPQNPDPRDPYSRPQNLRVVRNFIHHNHDYGHHGGYGVVTDASYPSIEGNTFLSNYHAIAASKDAHTAYTAWLNVVLSATPGGGSDFDAHGTGDDAMGGSAGLYFEIARNTFLGTNRENFKLRGTPTYESKFHDNVLRLSRGDALTNQGDSAKLVVSENQFSAPDPTSRLGVGDFDGDGTQDLFLATGAAWYYAPAGKAEWRYLNAQTDRLGTLLFGDFDADGRTDVFTQHTYSWDVSWGGASQWENINVSWLILGNAAIGDFIGDVRDDVFYADGQTWYASDGGVGQFTPLDVSRYRVASLRFGDFNADGKTDVFSVVDGDWKVAYSGTSGWEPLRSKLTDSVNSLTVADFNGQSRADVATSTVSAFTGWTWKVSYSGTDNWTTLRTAGVPLASAAAIGRFDSRNGADVLLWHDNYLDIAPRGAGNLNRHSREDMR